MISKLFTLYQYAQCFPALCPEHGQHCLGTTQAQWLHSVQLAAQASEAYYKLKAVHTHRKTIKLNSSVQRFGMGRYK